MGKLRQWFRNWFDRQLEKSLQRQADKMFLKGILVFLLVVAVIGTYIKFNQDKKFEQYYDTPILPMQTDKIA